MKKLVTVYHLGNIYIKLDTDKNMIVKNVSYGHDYQSGYEAFAKACEDAGEFGYHIERFWGWVEIGGGIGTPEDNGWSVG